MIKRYMFTRRAKNASYSNRTAKIGTLKGTLSQAIQKAIELSIENGVVSIHDYDNSQVVGITHMTNIQGDSFVQIHTSLTRINEIFA